MHCTIKLHKIWNRYLDNDPHKSDNPKLSMIYKGIEDAYHVDVPCPTLELMQFPHDLGFTSVCTIE